NEGIMKNKFLNMNFGLRGMLVSCATTIAAMTLMTTTAQAQECKEFEGAPQHCPIIEEEFEALLCPTRECNSGSAFSDLFFASGATEPNSEMKKKVIDALKQTAPEVK